jgi:hypothetical protein
MAVNPACQTNYHPYVARTDWVSTPFPTNNTTEKQLNTQYPWWGAQWRTPMTPYPPRVFYPYPILPRGVCEANTMGNDPEISVLTPNWAFKN